MKFEFCPTTCSRDELSPFCSWSSKKVRRYAHQEKNLIRLDSANDALEARVGMSSDRTVSSVVKCNLRKTYIIDGISRSWQKEKSVSRRTGKGSELLTAQEWQELGGKISTFSRVMRVKERTISKAWQKLVDPRDRGRGLMD